MAKVKKKASREMGVSSRADAPSGKLTRPVRIDLSQEMYELLEVSCKRLGMSRSAYMRMLLLEDLRRRNAID
jgi:hypothetical protein